MRLSPRWRSRSTACSSRPAPSELFSNDPDDLIAEANGTADELWITADLWTMQEGAIGMLLHVLGLRIRRRALLLTIRLACWASKRLAGPEVRAKMRELEPLAS
jgi:hypothetical protein